MTSSLQAAIERVAAVQLDPTTFPRYAPAEFRHAAVLLLDEIAQLRYQYDGGDLEELLDLDVRDDTIVVDLDDLREFVAAFHAEGDRRGYAACAAVLDWALAQEGRP